MPLTAHAGLLVQSVGRNVVFGGVNAMVRSWYSANVTPAVLPWAGFHSPLGLLLEYRVSYRHGKYLRKQRAPKLLFPQCVARRACITRVSSACATHTAGPVLTRWPLSIETPPMI